MTAPDEHLEEQYEDQHQFDDQSCGICGSDPCDCDEQYDIFKDRSIVP